MTARLAPARAYEKVGQRADAFRESLEVLRFEPAQPEALPSVARLKRGS